MLCVHTGAATFSLLLCEHYDVTSLWDMKYYRLVWRDKPFDQECFVNSSQDEKYS